MAYLTTDMSELLTEDYLESLNKADVWTINDLVSRDLMDIRRTTNIKFHVLKDIQDKVRQRYTMPCHDLNFLVEKSIMDCKMCPTGLPELTFALDGGFQTQEIVEFSGDSEAGKTEMCYLLCGEILSHFDDYHILYIAANLDFDHEKVTKYIRSKACNRILKDEDIVKALHRIQIARPTKLSELVHLLNTLVHADRRNTTKCIIIDSLSFIIQDDILDIKTANLDEADELKKFHSFVGMTLTHRDSSGKISGEGIRKEIIDTYVHEVMRLLTSIALTKNVFIVLTNSDSYLSQRKAWTNAIDHRIHLSRMSDFSRYKIDNPRATVCRATILKTIHNINKIGLSIPFAINDEGLYAVRLAPIIKEDDSDSDDGDQEDEPPPPPADNKGDHIGEPNVDNQTLDTLKG